jgi:hypothetical protein
VARAFVTRTRRTAAELADALHGLLGRRILVVASAPESSFCLSVRGRVIGIEASSADRRLLTLHFAGSQALTVSCADTTGFSDSSARLDRRAQWIELRLPEGPTVVIEEIG